MQFFRKILRLGITPEMDIIESNRVMLINITALYPQALYLFTTVYCIIYHYPRVVYVNAGAYVFTAIALLLNYKQKHSLAKTVLIITNSLVVFFCYKFMNNEPGVFIFFITITLAFGLFYSPKDEGLYFWITVFIVVLIFTASLVVPSRYFYPVTLSASMRQFAFYFCAVSGILLTVIYVSSIRRFALRNEDVLIRARKEAEEAMKIKARFLSTMSHELRTPLNGIIGTTDIIQQEAHPSSLQPHLDVLKNLSDHMLALVNDILDYSKIESGKVDLHHHRFNVHELLRKTTIVFRNQFKDKGLLFKVDADQRLAEVDVYFDELRLQQIINNLVSNALKFTAKGQVVINASIISRNQRELSVFFSVTDTGIGIPTDKQKLIFRSFSQGDSATTRKYGGTGLGLSISNGLVRLMNGNLYVTSQPGQGSSFYFSITMPLYKEQEVKVQETRLLSIERLKNLKVLIAEDNPVNMMVARRVLSKWNLQVTEVENGKEAVEKCNHEEFDVLLIDLEMPEMDGRMAVKEINKLNKNVPCIAFTAAVYENMKQDLLTCGFTDFLLKPFKPEDLYSKIVSALQQKLYYN